MSEPKTRMRLWCDASHLHALSQALDLVIDHIERPPSPASNAMSALIGEIVDRAARLRDDLDGG